MAAHAISRPWCTGAEIVVRQGDGDHVARRPGRNGMRATFSDINFRPDVPAQMRELKLTP